MDITISPFAIASYPDVLALWETSDGVGLSDADSRERIGSYLDRNDNTSFIAEHQGHLVGAVLAGHDGRRGYIHHLAVNPRFRRQGIGRLLVDACLAALGNAGIQKCHVFVLAGNTAGVDFWRSVGWTARTDLIVLSRTIDRPANKG